MYKADDLFDLSQTEHAIIFEGCDWAWDALKKIKSLGFDINKIKMVYTQGQYNLVEVVEAPSAEAMLAHTTWYAKQGYGKMIAMPAPDRTCR